MSILASALTRGADASQQQRGFDAAKTGRLYSDWFASATSGDAEIRSSYRRIIDRSRDLERNNDYVRGFLLACERNVIGAVRYDLRMDTGEYRFAPGKPPEWVPDRSANSKIETAWNEWGKRGTCTVCGKFSWRDVKRMLVRSVARDGNFIARKVRGPASGNRFGFALQLWEIDHLDLQKNVQLGNGNEVRFGIEFNPMKRPVAYWMMARHPGDLYGSAGGNATSIRVEASEIYHIFVAERAEQSIGYPWMVSAITRLRQLGAFEEAAVIAARIGASKMGFFKKVGDKVGEFTGAGAGANGAPQMDATPGSFESLPEGWQLDSWSPDYPNIQTGEFRKAMLRGVSSALGVSYNTLGNDLESVNFSSARVGLFEEREGWKGIQLFYSESFYEPVFSDWLESSLATGDVLSLPLAKFAKFNRPVFKARRWPFIDPLKEINAAREAIALRVTSRRQIIEEGGGDVEEVFYDNRDDERLATDVGIVLDDTSTSQVSTEIVDDETGEKTVITKKPTAQVAGANIMEAEKAEQEILREKIETYAVAVRAGAITPNLADEKALRTVMELPAVTADVIATWKEDGGARKPITLQGQKENAAAAAVVAAAAKEE